MKAWAVVGIGAVIGARRRQSVPDCARSARRPCASSSPGPSAAATRPDTTCPGRSAAARRGRSNAASRRSSVPASRRFSGLSAVDVPLGAFHVVDRDEGRLAAHRQPHVERVQPRIDLVAELLDGRPLLFGVRLGDARGVGDARDRHLDREIDARTVDAAGDRRGRVGTGRGRQRQMSFAREQAGGRIEPDPAGAGQIDLGPGVQVGEVRCRAGRAVERLHVGLELDQVAGDETRGQPQVPQHLHQQPGRIAARAASQRERLLAGLHARLHADQVLDRLVRRTDSDRRGNRPSACSARGTPAMNSCHPRAGGQRLQIRQQFGPHGLFVREGILVRLVLEEEIERIDDRHLGHQVDRHAQLAGLFQETPAARGSCRAGPAAS